MEGTTTSGSVAPIREDYFEDIPTGVEAEATSQADESGQTVKPWNPEHIRVSTRQFSLRNILDLIEEQGLELAPDFQRKQVWRASQKSRLIESILLQIPLPAFYFAEDTGGVMRVVDGLQRLSTINAFVRGSGADSFALSNLEYLDEQCGGHFFADLAPALQRRVNNTQIVAHVIDPTTPGGVLYDIFKRINTGGTPLNSQEIRHCMSRPRSREFLKKCTHAPEFDLATGGRFRDHIRMDDREVVLRYCAFWLDGVDGYARVGSMDDFLQECNVKLDDESAVPDERLDAIYESFRSSMAKAHAVFGEHAFRKWAFHQIGRNPINRPLFESWSYALAQYSLDDLIARRQHIVTAAQDLMTSNSAYVDAITTSTGDVKKVRLRFTSAAIAAEAGIQ